MPGHPRTRRTGIAARRLALAALTVASLVIALTAAEFALRVVAARTGAARTHRYMTGDPVLHHHARPSLSTTVSGVPFVTNSLGLRDREYASPKPASVVRVLMLGDSFTEGAGLALEQTVARRVERALAARGCGTYEVVNARGRQLFADPGVPAPAAPGSPARARRGRAELRHDRRPR